MQHGAGLVPQDTVIGAVQVSDVPGLREMQSSFCSDKVFCNGVGSSQ